MDAACSVRHLAWSLAGMELGSDLQVRHFVRVPETLVLVSFFGNAHFVCLTPSELAWRERDDVDSEKKSS